MGFVDLHNHLLYGIDDGCETPGETLEAARLLVALGYDEAAPSPHAVPELPSGDAAVCDARRADVESLLAREGIALALHANAENRLDEAFLARTEVPGRRGIGSSQRWVLVEAPFQTGVPALADLVFRLRRKGVAPLFAHPERCVEFERIGRAEEVVRLGGALQLNLGALAGAYGKGARKLAERFLGDELYAVAATDLHAPQNARRWLEDGLAAIEKRAGKATLERLCAGNPRRILAGEEVA
ncbi:tyrosine-protein phosphatase [Anaeromyxobacter oryzae]|uniref:protein-tyrosine-phosphatase n=1 Tax=Anaeromyxobacter oryzae TaxID=2918170 RepID=A0ABM7X4F9_9BACT|nr:CpsB/CapC family capsule biosynthesis tyrosine phosphatase [Anaeromyxobacter oryzae]BDG06694.1 tyrosine-protein phosphatase [Anaeromyxobacter oryzae]